MVSSIFSELKNNSFKGALTAWHLAQRMKLKKIHLLPKLLFISAIYIPSVLHSLNLFPPSCTILPQRTDNEVVEILHLASNSSLRMN